MNDLYFYTKTKKETGRLASRAKFAEEFPYEHGTFYLQSDGFACKMRSQERKSISGRANVVIEFHQISRAASHPILECRHSSDRLNSSYHDGNTNSRLRERLRLSFARGRKRVFAKANTEGSMRKLA